MVDNLHEGAEQMVIRKGDNVMGGHGAAQAGSAVQQPDGKPVLADRLRHIDRIGMDARVEHGHAPCLNNHRGFLMAHGPRRTPTVIHIHRLNQFFRTGEVQRLSLMRHKSWSKADSGL